MKRILALILAIFLLLPLLACGAADAPEPNARIFTDSLGREVALPDKVDQLAVSGPMAQLALFALCPDKLVGIAAAWDDSAGQYLEERYLSLPVIGQLYGGKVTVSVILLKPDQSAKRDEVSAAIKTNDFAEVAKKFSADSHAPEGGLWKDVIPSDCFRPEVCDEIAKMPKGTMSRWLDIDGWSFLIRKDAETETKQLYLEWVGRLRAASYIKIH